VREACKVQRKAQLACLRLEHFVEEMVRLRWHVQHGHIVFPKTMHPERMRENLELFNFELDNDQIAIIDALDKGEDGRDGPNPDTFDWIPSADTPDPVRR
jgi:diketogulonate reductase-like aldo/keto reductase